MSHISCIHTVAELPSVAVTDRSPISTQHKLIVGIGAVFGTLA